MNGSTEVNGRRGSENRVSATLVKLCVLAVVGAVVVFAYRNYADTLTLSNLASR